MARRLDGEPLDSARSGRLRWAATVHKGEHMRTRAKVWSLLTAVALLGAAGTAGATTVPPGTEPAATEPAGTEPPAHRTRRAARPTW